METVFFCLLQYAFLWENRIDSLLLSLACIIRKDYARMLLDMVGNKKSSEKLGELWPVCALFGMFCRILDYEYYMGGNGHIRMNMAGVNGRKFYWYRY